MNDAELDALLAGDDGVYPLDNVELDARSQDRGGGGGGGGSRPRPKRVTGGTTATGEPVSYVNPTEACAMLFGDAARQDDDDDAADPFDTSCDELEEEDAGSGMEDIDALFRDADVPAHVPRRGNRRRKKSELDCFGCVFTCRGDAQTNADSHIDGGKVNDLLKIFTDNFGRIHTKALARLMHQFFKHEIFLPLRAKGVDVPMWRTREIYVHFRDHQYDPSIFLVEQIDDYRAMSRALRGMSFAVTDSGTLAGMDKTMAQLHRTNVHLLTLYKTNPDGLNFHNPVHKIEFDKMAKLMGPYRNFAIENG
jgi:hypothetical protein